MIYISFCLAVFATALTARIAINSFRLQRLPGCGDEADCSSLISSRWSNWVRIPVAVPATVVYLLLSVAMGIDAVGGNKYEIQFIVVNILLTLTFIVAGSAVWFLFIEFAIIHKSCVYCNTIHLLGLSIAGMLFAPATFNRYFTKGPAWRPTVVEASLGLLFFIFGQLLSRPPSFAVLYIRDGEKSGSGSSDGPNCGLGGLELIERPLRFDDVSKGNRLVSLVSGAAQFNSDDFPRIGPDSPSKFIALILDYTCTGCRLLHSFVDRLVEESDDLGALIIPFPKNPSCNPLISEVRPGRGQSCQYARLAIGVWRLRRDQYREFGRYLCSEVDVPPLGLAIEHAQKLTGVRIDPNEKTEASESVIERAGSLYRALNIEKVPILLLPASLVVGKIDQFLEFRSVVEREIGSFSAGR